MEKDLDIEQITCPGCGRPVDKLRAGAVAVYETKMVYYCNTECKAVHLGTSIPASPPPRPSRESPGQTPTMPTPVPSQQALDTREPEAPPLSAPSSTTPEISHRPASPVPSPSPTPPPPPAEEEEEEEEERISAPSIVARITPISEAPKTPAPERAPIDRPQPPSVDESQSSRDTKVEAQRIADAVGIDELPARAPRAHMITALGLFLHLIFGFVLFGVSFAAPSVAGLVSPSSPRHEVAWQIMLAVATITVAWLIVNALRALPKRGWRVAVEEGLVAVGALLMLITGYLFPRSTGALLATPGVAALTWAGRWLEAVMRDALVSRLRPLLEVEGRARETIEAQLWCDSAKENTATRGWAEPAGTEPLGLPPMPEKSDILPQIAAIRGEGASPVGRLVMRWVFNVGVLIALPCGLAVLGALLFFTNDYEIALILSASLILAWSPRGLRLGWIGPMLTAAGMGVRRGLLFRDGAALEATARSHRVVFDARGTLTMGEPKVTQVIKVGDLDEDQILTLAAGVEEAAGHDPLGRAIVAAADARGLSPVGVRLARQSPGLGMSATSPQGDLLVGTRQLILGQGISVAEADEVAAEMEGRAETVLFVALAGRIQGAIGLRDELRPGAQDVATTIRALDVEPVLMTADSHLTGDALGKTLGFEHVRTEVAPDQWSEQIRSMRETGQGVAMITRPPRHEGTLAAADVGITLGSRGLEIEAAGVAIEGDDPTLAVKAVALARGALRTVRLNLFIAAATLVIVPGLASLSVTLLYYTKWLVPMMVALLSAVAPALLCWDLFASPRKARRPS